MAMRWDAPGAWRARRRGVRRRQAGLATVVAMAVLAGSTGPPSAEWLASAIGPPARAAMSNWASDVVPAALRTSPENRGVLEANRIELEVGGGSVLVQWSLSYDAQARTAGQARGRRQRARVQALARLERDGVEIARWSLGSDEALQPAAQDQPALAQVAGTASGLYVDPTPGPGRRSYVLKVWSEATPALSATMAIEMRTLICEER